MTLRLSFQKLGGHKDRTHDSEATDEGVPGTRKENEAGHEQISWGRIIRSIGILVFLALILQVVLSSVNSYLPLYMVDHHGIPPEWAGVVISIIAGSGIIGAPLGGALSDRIGRKRIILATISLSGPLVFAITSSPFGLSLLISLIFYGLAMSVRLPTMESFIADCVPVVRRTTVLGFYFFLNMETSGITTPLVGRFIDIWIGSCFQDARYWNVCCGGICIDFQKTHLTGSRSGLELISPKSRHSGPASSAG